MNVSAERAHLAKVGVLLRIHAGVTSPMPAMLRPIAPSLGQIGLVAFPGELRTALKRRCPAIGEVDDVVTDSRDAVDRREDVLRSNGAGAG